MPRKVHNHTGMMVNIRNGGEVSDTFAITNGIKQGCVLAPTLIFLSVMLEEETLCGCGGCCDCDACTVVCVACVSAERVWWCEVNGNAGVEVDELWWVQGMWVVHVVQVLCLAQLTCYGIPLHQELHHDAQGPSPWSWTRITYLHSQIDNTLQRGIATIAAIWSPPGKLSIKMN